MIRHYLLTASRHLAKNWMYSLITVAGLAVGLASVFFILQFLSTELSFDCFYPDAERIYRIAWIDETPQTRTPHPMAQAMVRDFPEVESAVSFTPLWGPGLTRRTFSVRNLEKDIRYDESGVLAVDTTFFNVFNLPLERGNAATVLHNPDGILISASMAKKYFGDEDALGKHLAINDDKYLIEVIGVFKDVPKTSHFHFDILVSYLREKRGDPNSEFYSWRDFGHYNYIKLKPGADAKALESRLLEWVPKYIDWVKFDVGAMKRKGFGFRLQPLTDIHLQSHLRWELESNGNLSYVYMMAAAAILILVIACFNFINLTTAQSAERAKEIGIRKTLGAFRRQLSAQFIGEAVLISFVAVVIAAILIEISLPLYQALTGNSLDMNYVGFVATLCALGLVVGILAGIYPAWYLSSVRPNLILRGKFLQSPEGSLFRNGFILFQFFASMALISSSIIIFSQLDFIRHMGLGFAQEELIVLPVKNRAEINPRFADLQAELLRIPGVTSVAATSNIPGRAFNQNAIFATADPQMRVNASEAMVDYDFFSTLGIEFAEGRGFNRANPADKGAFIINETAARQIFHGSAIGKELSWESEGGIQKGTVIGVARDFHYQSLHEPVRPIVCWLQPDYNYVLARIQTKSFDRTLASIESAWKKFDDRFGFEFSFLSDQLNKQYRSEQNMAMVMVIFAVLAAIIACFGLLGIAALSFRQKVKEVSVRKVLGASLASLTVLLLKNFTRTMLVAIVLAVPFTAWMMNRWLENFAFRVGIHPAVFIVSGALLVFVAWGTLGYLTLRVARVNPAETLKSE